MRVRSRRAHAGKTSSLRIPQALRGDEQGERLVEGARAVPHRTDVGVVLPHAACRLGPVAGEHPAPDRAEVQDTARDRPAGALHLAERVQVRRIEQRPLAADRRPPPVVEGQERRVGRVVRHRDVADLAQPPRREVAGVGRRAIDLVRRQGLLTRSPRLAGPPQQRIAPVPGHVGHPRGVRAGVVLGRALGHVRQPDVARAHPLEHGRRGHVGDAREPLLLRRHGGRRVERRRQREELQVLHHARQHGLGAILERRVARPGAEDAQALAHHEDHEGTEHREDGHREDQLEEGETARASPRIRAATEPHRPVSSAPPQIRRCSTVP